MARPSLLSPKLIEEARAVIGRCYSFEIAADLLGVDRRTLARWVGAGRRERRRRERGSVDAAKELHYQLAVAVHRALAKQLANCLDQIAAAAKTGKWQAAAWLLERRFPQHFGRRQTLAIAKLEKDLRKLEMNVRRTP